jgi:N-ethylmaleimide reductase
MELSINLMTVKCLSEYGMNLFSVYQLGPLTLPNRIVMAPMTRCRAMEGNVPSPLSVIYYTQRTSAGLIITEGSQVSPMGVGFPRTPGIYTPEQVTGWRKVTDGIHHAGGRCFLQLWHVGRVSHPDYLEGRSPLAPSALPVGEALHTPDGTKKPIPVPRALETDEIPKVVEQFRSAAIHARAAGFDGVEIHGANGYLLDQFLRDGSNQRTDRYGGSLENRMQFPLDVVRAVIGVWGGERTGYRISPHFMGHAMSDSDPARTFVTFARELGRSGIGYIHLIEAVGGRLGTVPPDVRLAPAIRNVYGGTLMVNGGYDASSGNEAIRTGAADLVSFGAIFLANPDLLERFRRNAPLNVPDISTYYTGEEHGYTDYPALAP